MITLECLLEFETNENRDIVLDLMRRFSSAIRYAYKRLFEGEKRKDFCYLEKSYRVFSPLKCVIISKDWITVANRLVPMLGAGTTSMPRFTILPKYRLLGLEVSEMAEYKYPNPNCAEQYSFVQLG